MCMLSDKKRHDGSMSNYYDISLLILLQHLLNSSMKSLQSLCRALASENHLIRPRKERNHSLHPRLLTKIGGMLSLMLMQTLTRLVWHVKVIRKECSSFSRLGFGTGNNRSGMINGKPLSQQLAASTPFSRELPEASWYSGNDIW